MLCCDDCFSLSGDEFEIVLLSTVRSLPKGEYHESVADRSWLMENMGFITDPHRICVGLTRAKFGLIIFGKQGDDIVCTCLAFISYEHCTICCTPYILYRE